eukprot:8964280-Karenia_brevis.AAC.1
MAALKLITSNLFASKSTWHKWPAAPHAGCHCLPFSKSEMAALKLIILSSKPLQLTTSAIASKTT